MKTYTMNEYIEYYKKYNKFINGSYCNSNKKLNEKQLKSKYNKYIKSEEKKSDRLIRNSEISYQIKLDKLKNKDYIDEKWEKVRLKVWSRDNSQCQYINTLDYKEYLEFKKDLFNPLNNLDCCHVFGKGAYPELKYDVENIVLGCRLFHSRIDTFIHPLTNKQINKEEHNMIWISIIGIDRWNSLVSKIRKK